MKRAVYYISDGTGITARAFGRSLLTQFEGLTVEEYTWPHVDTLEKANRVIKAINHSFEQSGKRPLLFATIVNSQIHNNLQESQGLLLDFFHTFIGPLEKELQQESSHTIGKTHGIEDDSQYAARIGAIHYTLSTDDGNNTRNYFQADFILVGVSRCGKTPTCLYLAMQFGLKAANYPFTVDDMTRFILPDFLRNNRKKLFGLTIDPERLHVIRTERRPNSEYASLAQCRYEVNKVADLLEREKIPFIDATTRSIEELSTEIISLREDIVKAGAL